MKKDIYGKFIDNTNIPPGSTCWIWHGYVQKSSGLPIFSFNGKQTPAKRAGFEIFIGVIPSRSFRVIDTCGNRLCVNPDHLELITTNHRSEQKTHCKRGHSLHDAFKMGDGRRKCRHCSLINKKRWEGRA